MPLEELAQRLPRGQWSFSRVFLTAQAAMAWGVTFPSGWFDLPAKDRAWMLQTYITREDMRAVEESEQ
jgi:hypothetical protein